MAEIILQIVTNDCTSFGTYHFCNSGAISWYDFAKAIFEESDTQIVLNPIHTEEYPTPAKRPEFSVLDTSKIKEELSIEIPEWRVSLKRAIINLKKYDF